MPLSLTSLARRVFCLVAIVLALLGLSSFSANAGLSSGLRNLLQGALGIDLRIDSFALDRVEATIGDTLRATVRVSNHGRAAATATTLTFWAAFGSPASTSNAYRLATVRLGTLQPSTRLTSVNTFPVPNLGRLGTYRIFAAIDSSSTEANKQNNTQAKSLQVIGPAFSDTDSTPVSEPDASALPPPPSPPVADGGSSPPPAPEPPASSDPSPPASESPSSPGSGSSPPPASDPTPPTPAPPATVACDYYASPTGRGDGNSPNAPFRIQTFWRLATPGKTLCLLNGTYTGSDSMISPSLQGAPANLSGTRGHPITIRAFNDGAVTIDGQFTRETFVLNGNSWFVVEGMNIKQSFYALLKLTGASSNNIVRRVVMWDAHIAKNISMISNGGAGTSNLFEDVALFGTGRKGIVLGSQAAGGTVICRRCWVRWEGSITIGPKMGISLNYRSYGAVCENCLITWSGESMPQEYKTTDSAGNVITDGGRYDQHHTNFSVQDARSLIDFDRVAPACPNTRVSGSLAYLKSTARNYTWTHSLLRATSDCHRTEHTMVLVQPGHPRFNMQGGIRVNVLDSDTQNAIATRLTSVRGDGDTYGTGVQTSGRSAGTSLAAVANPWSSTTTGATLCKRWVDGVQTNDPLWPWPMNARIKAATASAGAYSGPCPTCIGGRGVRKATDVTAEVESLLGPIPPHCRSSQ